VQALLTERGSTFTASILRDIERGGATEAITSSPNCYDGRERSV
jgi:hypothetical protein